MRCFCVLLVAAWLCAAGEVELAGMNAAKVARIPVRMKEFVDQGKAAGIVTLVMRHGHVAGLSAVGYQDLASKIPMRADSIFRIMSMTKPVSCVAAMILMEEGRLGIADPVEKYLPEFRGAKKPITLMNLMTHMSGVGAPKAAEDGWTLAEHVAAIAKVPVDFEPGTQWRYRTEGIDVLGRVVEVVSGMPFERFVAERIFVPLGMKDSAFAPQAGKAARMATTYTEEGGVLKVAGNHDTPYASPGAGMVSTAADMARFYQMMLNKGVLEGRRILSAASVEAMTLVQTGERAVGFAPGMGFGLGWGVVKDTVGTFRLCSIGSYGHGGAYRTYGWVDPAKDMVRVIMLQRTNGGGDVADEINAFLAMAGSAIEDGAVEDAPADEEMLAAQNEVRARVPVPPLVWSDKLAAMAQEWAETLLKSGKLSHRPNNAAGENIFEIRGGAVSAKEVVADWVAEAKDYDASTNTCKAGTCGHYTQIVWRRTKAVGCGVARGNGRQVWVCNYDPPGNIIGQRPY